MAPVVVAAVLLACLLAAGVARAGGAAVRTARAGAVADLTALAAVSSGRATAERVAARSGATLVDHASLGGAAVEVVVELDGVRAVAAADAVAQPSRR
ncbi:MAG TPA: hypothetical protein VKZ55_08680 [Microthrixaceae bacterium]|nr:hypothetical protein [Microthrixaceae bacterium]